MDYRNFVVRLAHRHGADYSVAVIESPFGRASGDFRIPEVFSGEASAATHLPRSGATRDLSPYEEIDIPASAPPPLEDDESAGRALFEAVFQGKVGELFLKSHDPDTGLRLKLLLGGGPDLEATLRLHALPWEWLTTSAPLALDAHFSVVRELEGEALLLHKQRQTRDQAKLRILLIGSNPNDTQPLNLEAEQKLLERMETRAAIDFVPLADISRRGLFQKLEEGFHGVHFMGHGDWVNGRPVLFFHDEHGDAEPVSGTQLVEEIRGLPRACWPRLFVLNACHGGASALGSSGLTGIAAELTMAGMPVVVAMRREIGDDAAILFSEVFYGALTQSNTVDEAMVKARLAIKREATCQADWATPCLYSKLDDGLLLSPKPTQAKTLLPSEATSRRAVARRWPWIVLPLLLALALLIWRFLPAEGGPVRLAIEPMAPDELAQVPPGLDPTSLTVAWSGIEGLVMAADRPDFRLQLHVDRGQTPNLFKAMVWNRDHEIVDEVSLHLPQTQNTAEIAGLINALTSQVLQIMGLAGGETFESTQARISGEALLANNRAFVLALEGDLQAAEAAYRSLAEQFPEYATAQAGLAAILMNQARYSEALTFAQAAANLAPNVALFHYHVGLCLAECQRQEEANAAFDRALALDPFLVDALHERAKAFLAQQDWDRSRRLLEKAIQTDPNRAVLHKTLGKWYLARGEPDQALTALQRAVELTSDRSDPTLAEALSLQAQAQIALGLTAAASATVRAFEALPNAALLPWFTKIQTLAAQLALQTDSPARARSSTPSDESQSAMFTNLDGEIWVAPDSANPWQPSKLSSVSGNSTIRLGADAHANLVCSCGNAFQLTGPGDWRLDEVCHHESAGVQQPLPILMTARQSSALGSLLVVASRSGQDGRYAILDPIGATMALSPDISWTEVPGAIAYEITIESDQGGIPRLVKPDQCRREPLQLGSEVFWILTWPWPEEPLSPGSSFTVRIWPEFSPDDSQFVDEFRAEIDVLTTAKRDRLAQLETQLEALPIDAAEGMEIRAQIYAAHGLWGMANHIRVTELARQSNTENLLALAETWLRADLDSLASTAFSQAMEASTQVLQKARAERGFGLLALRNREYTQAIAHLGLARANFLRESRADLVAQVNIAITKAWEAIEASGKSRRLELK